MIKDRPNEYVSIKYDRTGKKTAPMTPLEEHQDRLFWSGQRVLDDDEIKRLYPEEWKEK